MKQGRCLESALDALYLNIDVHGVEVNSRHDLHIQKDIIVSIFDHEQRIIGISYAQRHDCVVRKWSNVYRLYR